MVEESKNNCIFIYERVIGSSSPMPPSTDRRVSRAGRIWHLLRHGSFVTGILGVLVKKRHEHQAKAAEEWINVPLDLRPGEWVRVRSLGEIKITLDEKGAYRGLSFMPEMEMYCGKRFQVQKRVQKIMLESTGELRKLSTPTVLLEGAFCDGSRHQGCDRTCPCFWREQWLERI